MSKLVERIEKELKNDMKVEKLPKEVQLMLNALGEYEHVTADVEDVFTESVDTVFEKHGITVPDRGILIPTNEIKYRELCLDLYAAVLQDLALVILYD